ncbi:hypothetical protein ACQUKI_20720 [Ralstonia pseudosolanacearum]
MKVGIGCLLACLSIVANAQCLRFPAAASSAFDPAAGRISLPWRTDLPLTTGSSAYAWQGISFEADWRGYMAAFLKEIRATGIAIEQKRLTINPKAEWWIAPWMDYSLNGREYLNGLTAERGPDPGDLSKTSPEGLQTWAVGFYNRPGAYAIQTIYKDDPCDPNIPSSFKFPQQSASFKFLFTTGSYPDIDYLLGAPEIEAMINPPNDPRGAKAGVAGRVKQTMRLLQVDIAVRDPAAHETGWVMGTFVWKRPEDPTTFKGDWLFDNLVPVGLMWANDEGIYSRFWNQNAAIKQSKLNSDLAGVVWSASEVDWPQRPYPGFQGRLNGPADNPRSSCLACHAAAQWRRVQPLVDALPLDGTLDESKIVAHVKKFFIDVPGGSLHPGSGGQGTSLDYSLQLEAAFDRMCRACADGKLAGKTPEVCKVKKVKPNDPFVDREMCEVSPMVKFLQLFTKPAGLNETPFPRQ